MESKKVKRNALFKRSRPTVRKYETSDNGFLWAAYRKGSFDLPEELSQADFLLAMSDRFGQFHLLWIIEDECGAFQAGRGQVALVGIRTDGWKYEPTAIFFKWATPKNILRAAVAFFQMIRFQKDVGCCVVSALESSNNLLQRLKNYGVLYFRGRIPNGAPGGDLFLYSVNGRKGSA